MKKLIIVLMLTIPAIAQDSYSVRIDHYSSSDKQRLKDSDEKIREAIQSANKVKENIEREHGLIPQNKTDLCKAYDSMQEDNNDILIIHHIPDTHESNGSCLNGKDDGDDESLVVIHKESKGDKI